MQAISSPLLEVGIDKATGVVWNITGPSNMSLFEVRESLPSASSLGTLRVCAWRAWKGAAMQHPAAAFSPPSPDCCLSAAHLLLQL